MSSAKHFTEVLIGGKVYTLSGFEGEEYLQKVSGRRYRGFRFQSGNQGQGIPGPGRSVRLR